MNSTDDGWKDGLKPARSRAEITRVRQGWALILIGLTNILVAAAIAAKTFGLL